MSENNAILGHKLIKLQGIHRHCGDKTPMREYAVSLRIGNGERYVYCKTGNIGALLNLANLAFRC